MAPAQVLIFVTAGQALGQASLAWGLTSRPHSKGRCWQRGLRRLVSCSIRLVQLDGSQYIDVAKVQAVLSRDPPGPSSAI